MCDVPGQGWELLALWTWCDANPGLSLTPSGWLLLFKFLTTAFKAFHYLVSFHAHPHLFLLTRDPIISHSPRVNCVLSHFCMLLHMLLPRWTFLCQEPTLYHGTGRVAVLGLTTSWTSLGHKPYHNKLNLMLWLPKRPRAIRQTQRLSSVHIPNTQLRAWSRKVLMKCLLNECPAQWITDGPWQKLWPWRSERKEWHQHGIEFQVKLRSQPLAIHKIQPAVSLRSCFYTFWAVDWQLRSHTHPGTSLIPKAFIRLVVSWWLKALSDFLFLP